MPVTANASILWDPYYIAFDLTGNLWAIDWCYNRVLRYSPPFSNGQAATLVLGQPDFNSQTTDDCAHTFVIPPTASSLNGPSGIAFDFAGN
jgi:hypothetical protein